MLIILRLSPTASRDDIGRLISLRRSACKWIRTRTAEADIVSSQPLQAYRFRIFVDSVRQQYRSLSFTTKPGKRGLTKIACIDEREYRHCMQVKSYQCGDTPSLIKYLDRTMSFSTTCTAPPLSSRNRTCVKLTSVFRTT